MKLFILILSVACVIFYGYALGGYAAYSFGRGRPDYMLLEFLAGTVCGAGALLMWKKWLKDTTPDLIVFDVDGVLIDSRESYMLATAEAVRWCWQNLLGGNVDCEGYTSEYFKIAKSHPAFNDDAAIAWVMLHAMLRTGYKNMKEAFPSQEAWKKEVDAFAFDAIVEDLARADTQVPLFTEVRDILLEIYFGAETYTECKGREACGAGGEGLWKKDTPEISKHWKELRLPVGVYTGRTHGEMALAFKLLNWSDFPDDMMICSDDGILKPSPEGLAVLCKRSGAKYPVFFGDTPSDRAAWSAFGKGEFVGIGSILESESRRGEFLHFNTLEEALSSLLQYEIKDKADKLGHTAAT